MLSHSSFLSHMAGNFRRTLYITDVVASPCTSPRQRTGAPPHSKHSVRLWALSHHAFLPAGSHAISACTCDKHAHATASAVDLLPSTCACGVWSYNTWVVFHPLANMRHDFSLVNVAPSYRTRRTTHHARAAALLTAPILNCYPWHQLVWCPPRCVPPLTCCPTQRVPA